MKTYQTIVLSLLALVSAAPFAQADLIYATRVNALNAAGNNNFYSNYYFSNGKSSDPYIWCTQQNNGGGSYIVNDNSRPIMLCDLGAIQSINGISIVQYPYGTNPVASMKLEFYDTPAISGDPIATKTLTIDYSQPNISWDNSVNARFVKITMLTNQGGDRFGVADLKFDVSSVATPISVTGVNANAYNNNYSINNLIDKDATTQWCSAAYDNSTGGYFASKPNPEFTFTFDGPQTLTGISVQPYRESAGNSIRKFKLEFYDSDGNLLSVEDDPNYSFTMTDSSNGVQNYFSFPTINNVASLKMVVTGNFRGMLGGGDRIGFSEVFFSTLETKMPTTPVMYNEPMHADNIVRPASVAFANEISQRVTFNDANYALSNL
ncbi:MAG: discoidin domain-containing protein, partial [Thermoguttaceae bacterium]|nr:discoidin domain-containing protein [Thermoguttaceae bacterium]